jgi:hypothetical protein
MRTVALAFTGLLAVCINAPVYAATLPTVAQCHAIAQKRGAGEGAGSRNHERFIQQCLAGRIPMEEVHGVPEPVREYRSVSYGKCHELAEQRGAGETTGGRNHQRFIEQCMAGKIPTADVTRIKTETDEHRKKSEAECHALAQQRGAGETAGSRNHQRFIDQCMAGRIP